MGYQISNLPGNRRNVLYLSLALSLVLLAGAIFLTVIQPSFWWSIPVCLLIIVPGFIPSLNKVHEDEAIIIDENGIRRGSKSYPWSRIDHCYYSSRYESGYTPERVLVIVLKKGEKVVLELNKYSFKKKELIAAINQYSKKKICYMTGNDIKHESIHALFLVLAGLFFMLILFLLLYPGR